MTIAEFFTSIKDVVLTATAITGSFVALKGLSTWKRQLSGQADYNLARNILIHVYKYRDAMTYVRNPLMLYEEMAKPPTDEKHSMSEAELRVYGTRNAYQTRWDKMTEQRAEIYSNMIEAEAVWGRDLSKLLKPLFEHERELLIQIQYHLKLINREVSDEDKEFERDYFKMNILYASFPEEKDEFRQAFSASLVPVEDYLRVKLAR